MQALTMVALALALANSVALTVLFCLRRNDARRQRQAESELAGGDILSRIRRAETFVS